MMEDEIDKLAPTDVMTNFIPEPNDIVVLNIGNKKANDK